MSDIFWADFVDNGKFLKPASSALSKDIKKFLDGNSEEQVVVRPGIHASQVSKKDIICWREEFYFYKYGTRRPKIFQGDLYLAGLLGSAHHALIQNKILGPMGRLSGTWFCSNCGHSAVGTMPVNPCSKCAGCTSVCEIGPSPACVLCEKMTWYFEEPKITRGKYLVGHCDGLVGDMALEIKTLENSIYETLSKPYPSHVLQGFVYADALGKDKILIAYFNRNDLQCKEFVVEIDRKRLNEEIYKPLAEFESCVEEDRLPALKLCKVKRNKKAKVCPHCEKCFKEEL